MNDDCKQILEWKDSRTLNERAERLGFLQQVSHFDRKILYSGKHIAAVAHFIDAENSWLAGNFMATIGEAKAACEMLLRSIYRRCGIAEVCINGDVLSVDQLPFHLLIESALTDGYVLAEEEEALVDIDELFEFFFTSDNSAVIDDAEHHDALENSLHTGQAKQAAEEMIFYLVHVFPSICSRSIGKKICRGCLAHD